MPNRPVTVRRWEIVAAFIFVVAAAAGSVQWSNHNIDKRIDEAEKRITMNTVTNEQQNEVRRQLVAGFRRSDARFCMFVNDLRAQNRLEAYRTYANLDRTLRLLNLKKTPEIVDVAQEERDRVLAANKEVKC